jgi:hypothetical protein
MGEVYRARDTRLGRDVAVKILPESLARDPDRMRRFEQEARAVAALSHPSGLQGQDDLVPNSWARDGKVLSTLQISSGGSDIVLIPATGGKMTPFLATKAAETNAMISPDNKWVAYASNESGGNGKSMSPRILAPPVNSRFPAEAVPSHAGAPTPRKFSTSPPAAS